LFYDWSPLFDASVVDPGRRDRFLVDLGAASIEVAGMALRHIEVLVEKVVGEVLVNGFLVPLDKPFIEGIGWVEQGGGEGDGNQDGYGVSLVACLIGLALRTIWLSQQGRRG
jgi:hypothetical protein